MLFIKMITFEFIGWRKNIKNSGIRQRIQTDRFISQMRCWRHDNRIIFTQFLLPTGSFVYKSYYLAIYLFTQFLKWHLFRFVSCRRTIMLWQQPTYIHRWPILFVYFFSSNQSDFNKKPLYYSTRLK